jgi:HD-like signal output (HDOD) protein
MTLVDRICEQVNTLPTLPTIYSALTELIDNPRATPEDAARVIATDQATAFKILRSANSAFYGLNGRIDTISQAIIHLGFNEIKNLVAAISIVNMFKRHSNIDNFCPVDFWAHSIGVGVMTRFIGQVIGLGNVENFFLAGILHDLGKLIFVEYAKNEYIEALRIAEEKRIPLKDAEMMVLGIDHTFAGELLTDRWKLPVSIKQAIRYHHSGTVDDKHNVIVASVHIANICAKLFGMGYSGDAIIQQPNYKVWDVLRLPEKIFTASIQSVMRDYEMTANQLLHN